MATMHVLAPADAAGALRQIARLQAAMAAGEVLGPRDAHISALNASVTAALEELGRKLEGLPAALRAMDEAGVPTEVMQKIEHHLMETLRLTINLSKSTGTMLCSGSLLS